MIPHKLVMSAFGPYADRNEINFDEFGGKGIFLITGETGAGKTTIFDAITYALYGKLTAEDRSPEKFRCDSADENTLTFVELEFTQDGTRYFIRRSPNQKKLNRKTPEKATVTLEYKGMVPLRKNREIDNKIEEIVGLTYSQWKQVSMLAQGEFKQLLTADTDDRTKTLRSIFSTKSIQDIEAELWERAKKVKDETSRIETNINQTISKVVLPEDSPYYEDLEPLKNITYLDELLEKLSMQISLDDEKISSLKKEASTLQGEMNAISVEKGKAEEVNKQFANLESQRTELEKLKAEESEILKKEQDIKEIEETVKDFKTLRGELLTLRERKKSKQSEIDSDNETIERTERLIEDAVTKLKEAHEKDPEVIDLNDRIAVLVSKKESFVEIGTMEEKLGSLKTVMNGKISILTSIQKEWNEFVDDRSKKREYLKENDNVDTVLQEKQDNVRNLAKEKGDLQIIEQKCKEYIRDEKTNAELRESCKKASDSATEAKEKYRVMEELFFASTVGRLASTLEEGKPCPVCGSLHHDNPAPPHEGAPTEAELDAAKKDWMDKNDIYSSTNDELTESTTALKGLIKEINERSSEQRMAFDTVPMLQSAVKDRLTEIDKQTTELNDAISKLSNTSKELAEVKQYLEKSDDKEAELSKRKEDAAREEQDAVRNYETQNALVSKEKEKLGFDSVEELNAKITELTSEKDEIVKNIDKCEKSVTNLNNKLSELNGSISAKRKDLSDIDEDLSAKETNYSYLLDSKGITDETVSDRLGREDTVKDLRTTVSDYKTNLSTCQKMISDLEQSVEGKSITDISQLETELSEKNSLHEEKNKEIQSIGVRKTHIENWMASLRNDKKELDAIGKEGKEIVELSDVISGSRSMDVRISFEAYIQGVFFSRVLSFANSRLMRMTGGRFEMKKRKADDSGNSKKGLEIDVLDNYNGGVRPANSLSGGQSFMASLALALGLSDAVQTMKGGIHIDTLFVDEGFGSLDGATREESVDVLLDLANSNVLVGIISHIPEFKEAFSRQIVVSAVEGRQGESKTRIVTE